MTDHQRNVLDLRHVSEERDHRSARVSGRERRGRNRLHRPAGRQMDWVGLRREALKYLIGLGVAGTIVTGAIVAFAASRDVQAATSRAKLGVTKIESGLSALAGRDAVTAQDHFRQAVEELQQARLTLQTATSGIDRIIDLLPVVGPRYRGVVTLLRAAENGAEAGLTASQAVPRGVGPTGLTIETNGVIRGSLGWLAILADDQPRLERVSSLLLSSYRDTIGLDPASVPSVVRDTMVAWQRIGEGLFGSPERLSEIVKLFLGVTGQTAEQEYLVMFQNNDELRPTGGFMGTYALMKFLRGTFAITDAPGNGPYALKDQTPTTIRPPAPLDEITPAMTMIDANWYPDARTSGQAIRTVYQLARGFEPIGVIYITPDLVERLLQITGPIVVPDTTTEITAGTFLNVAEQEAEISFDKALNAPKQLILRLLPALLQRVSTLSTADALRALALVVDEAERGNLIITSDDRTVSTAAAALGWDGGIRPGTSDFFAAVDGNVNSGKTDRSIQTSTDPTITPSSGDWVHRVVITRQHNALPSAPLHGVDNTEYIRLIVPVGANVTGIEGATTPPASMFITTPSDTSPLTFAGIDDLMTLVDPVRKTTIARATDATTIGFWSTIRPGERQTITVAYTVPHATMVTDGTWTLVWRRQPGSVNRHWSLTVDAAQGVFRPQTPTAGWAVDEGKWVWGGNGDYGQTFTGSIHTK